MFIKTLAVGHLETNCYIVGNEDLGQCAVIDPGDESNTILDYIEDNHLTCTAILLTHGHFDHVGAVETVQEETGAVVYMNAKDDKDGHSHAYPYSPNAMSKYYDDGDVVETAGLSFHVIATPGHTPGSVSLLCEDALFTGDTLFRGSCGRFDLEGGDEDAIMHSLAKLCALDGNYDVYPGHGDYTTLHRERSFNYYCREAAKLKHLEVNP